MEGPIFCKKCGDKVPVCDWGLGLCDACRRTPAQAARYARLDDASLIQPPVQAKHGGVDIEEAQQRLKRARQVKDKTQGAFLQKGDIGTDDKIEIPKKTKRHQAAKPHDYNEKAQGYRSEGRPHTAKAGQMPMFP